MKLSKIQRWHYPATALAIGLSFGCESLAPQRPGAVGSYQAVEIIEPSSDSTRISPDQFAQVIPRTTHVRAEPATLELRIGEQIGRQGIRLYAFDEEDRPLGYFAIYDSAMDPGAAVLEFPGGVRARQAGESVLTLTAPLWRASGGVGAAPQAVVRVVVRE